MNSRSGAISRLLDGLIVLAPGVTLFVAAVRTNSIAFAIGAAVIGLAGLWLVRKHQVWKPPLGLPVAILLVSAAAWFCVDPKGSQDSYSRAARGSLLMVAAMVFGINELFRSGHEPRRRANAVVRTVLDRKHWPLTLLDCREIPEVLALQEALQNDLSPLVRLMSDPRPEVRAAGFAAVEGRRHWRLTEAQLMLEAARNTVEPGVRAVAALSLGGIRHTDIYAEVALFLRDPAQEVRAAAAAGLLSDGGQRWPIIREHVKNTLLDPKLANDGSLPGATGLYPNAAIEDFTAWAVEGGLVGERSVRTLISHWNYRLKHGEPEPIADHLLRQIFDPNLATELRVGYARLLNKHKRLTPYALDRMTGVDQPGPVRLMAAEMLLIANPDNPDGIDVLRGLGRQQNREISINIARILQTHLAIPFGLPAVLPAMQSKQAAEIVKRVVMWASGRSIVQEVFKSENPTPPVPAFGTVPKAMPFSRRSRDGDESVDFGGGQVDGPQSIIR
jgi:hypothetical protein